MELDDGAIAYATDGTPVDCVRFGDLGLVGERPDLIVSGINHGSNLGDDITYSGTVAAALEGIVLGIPAIAISQQSGAREMGFLPGRRFDFAVAAGLGAELVRLLVADRLPAETLLNVNCPAGEPAGIEVTRLGKRLYNDELRLVDEDGDGRRRYEIYGFEPSFEDEPGTDLSAVARGRISLPPVDFDLTDRKGLDRLRQWDLDRYVPRGGGGPREGLVSAKGAAKRAEELRREIARHDRRYYVLDDPQIGDDEYDALLDELRKLEEEHPDLRTPTRPRNQQPMGECRMSKNQGATAW